MKSLLKFSLLVAALAATAGNALAAPAFQITEVYSGLSGEDGTVDWIEVTNTGASTGDTSTLLYDDTGPNVADAGTLDSFMLAPGESAIFLLDDEPSDDATYSTAIEEFTAIWGAGISVGLTNGGGNLGQNGDEAYLGVDNAGSFDIIDSLIFTAALGGELETIEDLDRATDPRLSVFGVNGAFGSAFFFNDNLGVPGNMIALTGSPGIAIPEPASALLAMIGLLAVARRRG